MHPPARQASAVGAHREAAALYALAIRYDDRTSAERAPLLEAHAWECYLIGQSAEATVSRRRAIELWRGAANPLKQGENLAWLALLLLAIEQWAEAEQATLAAIHLLEDLPPGRELALAYRTQALLHHNRHEYAEVIAFADKAVVLAEQAGDARILAMAYDTLGSTWLALDHERGQQILERCLTVAREAGLDARIASIYGNLGSTSCEFYRFADAARYLAEGIAFTAERDLDLIRLYMHAWQALTDVYLGHWDESVDAANEVLQWRSVSSNSRIPALVALGRVRVRRGDVNPTEALNEAAKLAMPSGFFHHMMPVRTAWAEAAWLSDDRTRTLQEVHAVYEQAVSKRHAWYTGELAFWRWRAGDRFSPPDWIARPFALQIAGQWVAAA